MALRAILFVLGLFHLVNGIWMLAAPASWYAAVPGVAATGPFNHHFVIDIGLAFIASGVGLMIGVRASKTASAFALAGATWPALHALFHLQIWLTHGLPDTTTGLINEGVGVILVGLLGASLAFFNARKEGIV